MLSSSNMAFHQLFQALKAAASCRPPFFFRLSFVFSLRLGALLGRGLRSASQHDVPEFGKAAHQTVLINGQLVGG